MEGNFKTKKHMHNYLAKLCFCMDTFVCIRKAMKTLPKEYTYMSIQFCILFNKVQAMNPGLRII